MRTSGHGGHGLARSRSDPLTRESVVSDPLSQSLSIRAGNRELGHTAHQRWIYGAGNEAKVQDPSLL